MALSSIRRVGGVAIALCAGLMVAMAPQGAKGPPLDVVVGPAPIVDGPELPDPTDWREVAIERLVLKDASMQEMNLPSGEVWAPFIVPMDMAGEKVELWLEPHSIRSADDFRVQTIGADGLVTELPAPTPRTYKGTVPSAPGSTVRASLINGQLHAQVRLLDGASYMVQPMTDVDPFAPVTLHAVYNVSDVLPQGGSCGTDTSASPNLALRAANRESAPRDIGGFRQMEVGFDVDFEYYQLQGSNTTNVVNDVESIMNLVEAVYNGENVNVNVEVTTISIRTVNGAPYQGVTSAGGLLNAFQFEWNNTPAFSASFIRRDVVHMFTGKNISSGTGTIGIAFLGTVCQSGSTSAGYGLSQSRFSSNLTLRTALTAHEIGHNFSCTHCNNTPTNGDGSTNLCNNAPTCGLMCTAVASCGGPATAFGACNAGQAIAYRDALGSCMTATPAFQTIPFEDTFEGNLSNARWIWNQNTAVTAPPAALRPAPSGTSVLNPNATTLGGINLPDQIRSNFMSLSGVANAQVSFFWNRSGIPNAGALIVDYWANNIRWVELGRITSDGVNPAGWTNVSYPVPASGQWGQFRIRFRVTGSTTTAQNWYVDNLRIGTPASCNPADIAGSGATYLNGTVDIGPDNELGIDDFVVFLAAFSDSTGCPGTAPCNPADIAGSGATYTSGSVDIGPDGDLGIDDFVVFLAAFSDATGCP